MFFFVRWTRHTHIADSYGIRQQRTGSSTGRPQKMTSVQKGTDRQKHTSKSMHTHGIRKQQNLSVSELQLLSAISIRSSKVYFFKIYFYFLKEMWWKVTQFFMKQMQWMSNSAMCKSLSPKNDKSYQALLPCPPLISMVLFINIALQKNFLFEWHLS